MRLLRRTFLKIAGGVFAAVAGLLPDLSAEDTAVVGVKETRSWQMFVPSHGRRGAVVDGGFSTYEDAQSAAVRFADGGPWRVWPQDPDRPISNGIPAHIHPLVDRRQFA